MHPEPFPVWWPDRHRVSFFLGHSGQQLHTLVFTSQGTSCLQASQYRHLRRVPASLTPLRLALGAPSPAFTPAPLHPRLRTKGPGRLFEPAAPFRGKVNSQVFATCVLVVQGPSASHLREASLATGSPPHQSFLMTSPRATELLTHHCLKICGSLTCFFPLQPNCFSCFLL